MTAAALHGRDEEHAYIGVTEKYTEAASKESGPTTYELQDTELAANEEGRKFLKYLVECAMPEGVIVHSEVEGTRYEFAGAMGLAPNWLKAGLNETEERRVSACMLARTNFFGETVQISMRAEDSGFKRLKATAEEREEFSLYEGDFFGNLFSEDSTAATCLGERTEEENNDLIFKKRVCTEADEIMSNLVGGKTITRCGFILTGKCSEPDAHTVNGKEYKEVISVYLKPDDSPDLD